MMASAVAPEAAIIAASRFAPRRECSLAKNTTRLATTPIGTIAKYMTMNCPSAQLARSNVAKYTDVKNVNKIVPIDIGPSRVTVMVSLTMPNQPRADERHAARRLHLDVRLRLELLPFEQSGLEPRQVIIRQRQRCPAVVFERAELSIDGLKG